MNEFKINQSTNQSVHQSVNVNTLIYFIHIIFQKPEPIILNTFNRYSVVANEGT